jgi:hypothetical protein
MVVALKYLGRLSTESSTKCDSYLSLLNKRELCFPRMLKGEPQFRPV